MNVLNEIKKWCTDKKDMLKVIKLEREQEEYSKIEKAEKLKSPDIEFEEWKKEVKEIKWIRSKKIEEYNQKIDEEEKKEKIKCEINRDKAINDLKFEIEQLKDRIEIEQQELISTDIFKRKEELVISIVNLREKIKIKEDEIMLTKNKFLNSINDLEKKTLENKANYEMEIKRKYPITVNPDVILRYEKLHGNKDGKGVLTKTCSENINIRDVIFEELLRMNKPMSITDLMKNSLTVYELTAGSCGIVSEHMSMLKKSGKVIRIREGKKVLFMINYDRYMEEFDE